MGDLDQQQRLRSRHRDRDRGQATGHHEEQLRLPSRERDHLLYGGTIRENIGGDREPSKRKKSAKSSYAHRERGKGNYGSRRGSSVCIRTHIKLLFTHHVQYDVFYITSARSCSPPNGAKHLPCGCREVLTRVIYMTFTCL